MAARVGLLQRRRSPSAVGLAVSGGAAIILCGVGALSFAAAPSAAPPGAAAANVGAAARAAGAARGAAPVGPSAAAWLALAGLGLAAAARAGGTRGHRAGIAAVALAAKKPVKSAKEKGGKKKDSSVFDVEGGSIMSGFQSEEAEEDAEAEMIEDEMQKEDKALEQSFTEDGVQGVAPEDEEEDGGQGQVAKNRQVDYKLYPSRAYVMYIAMKNAERNWTRDGPDGKNRGCLEVQVALLTERIRNLVIHAREHPQDNNCRNWLVSLVSRRRRYLDKLSWKDLDAYIKVRQELKIRHVYRMEALIGRLPEYRYTIRDRKPAPGRKVSMQLKKRKRLLQNRLATQLRQGKDKSDIFRTKTMIRSRAFASKSYDEASALLKGKAGAPTLIDPLNIP